MNSMEADIMKLTKHLFVAFGLCAALALPALAADAPMEIPGAKTVDAKQVVDLIGKESKLVVVDARIPEEYREAAIEGAVNVVNTDVTADTLAKVVPTKLTPVLFYCNGLKCGRAADATRKAMSLGYTNVYYYALGMTEWKEKGMPTVKNE
jgi:rhodanese-related sulfurtransferase